MEIRHTVAGANTGAVGQHIMLVAGNQLDAKQAFRRIGIFDHPMTKPQSIIQCGDHRFQPRELPNVPAVKVFDAGFHVTVRAPHLKTASRRESFVVFVTMRRCRPMQRRSALRVTLQVYWPASASRAGSSYGSARVTLTIKATGTAMMTPTMPNKSAPERKQNITRTG